MSIANLRWPHGAYWLAASSIMALGALLAAPVTAKPEGRASAARGAQAIDRRALVRRHNPKLTAIDPASPLMVGNGNIALTADITGLATFQERYSPLVPLMIQAQWAWHSFPNPERFRYEQSLVPIDVRGKTRWFPWLTDWEQAKTPLISWLRSNPHRFSLGRLALYMERSAGGAPRLEELASPRQSLDLWTGRLSSAFELDGASVEVETSVHPELDMIVVQLSSELLESGRLGVDLRFPGVSPALQPDPADWAHPEAHATHALARTARGVLLERKLDATRYHVQTGADRDLEIEALAAHHYRFRAPGARSLTLLVSFSEQRPSAPLPGAEAARAAVAAHWQRYWSSGGSLDFSGSLDPRAAELERRVVLSQYLMAVNAAGSLPPQEEGLLSNSWYGKFHLEMHLWHAAHFATWGRPELLERSMGWYRQHLPLARERARGHGARGAWWPKMVGPEGRESPSTITPFIMWQQPHPIYLSELIYRARKGRGTLERYRDIVFETAELLASYPHLDAQSGHYRLGPPIIPAQEVFPPLTTYNPTFELEYFRFGLETAQRWRERLGLGRNPAWQRVLAGLAPLPQRDGLYLAVESGPELWSEARSPRCAPGQTRDDCPNRDHPSFVAALGLLPGSGVDRAVMQRTLDAVRAHWDQRQTWGWDYPLLAMTAARLHQPERAVELLFADAKNFRFGVAGMTPRVHLDAHATALGVGAAADGPGYRRAAETYFPSNGALLLAVGLMAAGWDGQDGPHPGFPKDGRWVVRSEGIAPLP